MFAQGIPLAAFEVSNMDKEFDPPQGPEGGLHPKSRPARAPVIIAVFADKCGNLIQIDQPVQD